MNNKLAIEEAMAKLDELENNINSIRIKNNIIKIGLQNGVMIDAIGDLLNRAKGEFTYNHNFKLVSRKDESLEEWLKIIREEAPHLWPSANRGIGAVGGSVPVDNAVVISKKDASQHQNYLRAKALAEKRGVRLIIR